MLAVALSMSVFGMAMSPPQVARADEKGPTKVLFLLDVSGSMNEKIASGGTKFAAAKNALKDVAGALPAGTDVGLRVYGSRIAEPRSQNPRACTDSELVLPIGPLDTATMNKAVDSFTAKGETPISYSLGKAVDDLGTSGRRVLVLISDGEESCVKDPCPTARKLATSGIDLQFNAVGLGVNGRARQQLQCIADAGNGSYYDATRSGELSEAIRKITQRALRPFQFDGTPVRGAAAAVGAPEIRAGRYTDVYDTSNTPRYYRVNRAPGSTVTASIASIVNPYPAQNRDFWQVGLSTMDGTSCGTYLASSPTYQGITVVSGAVHSATADQTPAGPGSGKCATEPTLSLSLSRRSAFANKKSNPVEIQVTEEAPITNLKSLPKPLTSYEEKGTKLGLGTSSRAVLGGSSFSSAESVGPGSWTDSMATGETVFYKVRLEPGQRLRTTLYAPAPKSSWSMSKLEALTAELRFYSPSRLQLTDQSAPMQGDRKVTVTATSPQVRVRNRENPWPQGFGSGTALGTASVGGDYFVAVALDPLARDFAGRVMSIRLEIAVDGQPTGQPAYAPVNSHPSATQNPAGSSSPTGLSSPPVETPGTTVAGGPAKGGAGSSRVPLGAAVGVGLAVAAAGIGVGMAVSRRRVGRS